MTPCAETTCPVKNARWVISAREAQPFGERWYSARKAEGWWCRSHARYKARYLNHEEEIDKKGVSLELFLNALYDKPTKETEC